MTPVPRQSLRERREDEIARGALNLFIEKGFHATSVREIAAASNLSMGGLYEYIESKGDVLWLVYRHLLTGLEGAVPASARGEDIEATLAALIAATADHAPDVQFMYREAGVLDPEGRERLASSEREQAGRLASMVESGIASGHLAEDDPELVAHLLMFLTAFYPLRRWLLRHRPDLDAGTVARSVARIVVRGLAVRSDTDAP